MEQYSFLTLEEPTDEQLAELMHEVALEAESKSFTAEKKFWKSIHNLIQTNRLKNNINA